MYNYKFNIRREGLNWDDGGGLEEIVLLHEKRFSDKDLKYMYDKVLKSSAEKIKNGKEWWIKIIGINDIKNELIKIYGFCDINIDVEFDTELTGDEYMDNKE